MSSLVRKIEFRLGAKRRGGQIHKDTPDGGYKVLRPTKGWLSVSPRRLNAQRQMAAIFELAALRRGRRA